MSNQTCILTGKDFTILEVMRDRCVGKEYPLAPILARKIETARVVFREDVPGNVATLSSRVTFSVNGRDPDTRVISHDRMTSPVGLFLPITTARGLALLGLAEGQDFVLTNGEGIKERILLQAVHYQPEAAKREREMLERQPARPRGKPQLTLVHSAYREQPSVAAAHPDDFDPGPLAA